MSKTPTTAILVYPHQLWEDHPALGAHPEAPVYLVRDPLFFTQYSFSTVRRDYLALTMAGFADDLTARGRAVRTLTPEHTSRSVFALLPAGVRHVVVAEVDDDWLSQALHAGSRKAGMELTVVAGRGFLLPRSELHVWADEHPRLLMADFYRMMRRRLGILVTDTGDPVGGRWSFDTENRRRIPASHDPPPQSAAIHGGRARRIAADRAISLPPYPIVREDALRWLDEFATERLTLFGDYEDAMDRRDDRWYHGLLTPMLNSGLITPQEVADRIMAVDGAPLNSQEGFLRQVIGWREFMRLTYHVSGRRMRTGNYWNHTRPMPDSFYTGTTGLPPFDRAVHKTVRLGWAHHIERLMVLGNLMLLCRIHPDAVYRWFMELYVDAFDWVMVPNVYGMSQYADGGLITTKPYLSGSNYLRKMSDEPRGPWQEIWDGLYWRFIHDHRDVFAANHRMSMMPRSLDRLDKDRTSRIFAAADRFLAALD